MAKGKNKSGSFVCGICVKVVHAEGRLNRGTNYYRCACCSIVVHKECAEREMSIAPNGLYYCSEHLYVAPGRTTRGAGQQRKEELQKDKEEKEKQKDANDSDDSSILSVHLPLSEELKAAEAKKAAEVNANAQQPHASHQNPLADKKSENDTEISHNSQTPKIPPKGGGIESDPKVPPPVHDAQNPLKDGKIENDPKIPPPQQRNYNIYQELGLSDSYIEFRAQNVAPPHYPVNSTTFHNFPHPQRAGGEQHRPQAEGGQQQQMVALVLSMKKELDELRAKVNPPPAPMINAQSKNPLPQRIEGAIEREEVISDSLADSLRRARIGDPYASLNNHLMELQILESKRNIHRVLPLVKSAGYEWKIFYKAFKETEHLYSKTENVRRLQDAIQCESIKAIAGINLFNTATYVDALISIDKKIGRKETLLLDEKTKLIQQEPLKSNNYAETISFIERIKNYTSLVNNLGNLADKTDTSLLAHIARTLPFDLRNKWRRRYHELYDQFGAVYMGDLSSWLDSAVKDYETELLFEKLDPYKNASTKKEQPAKQDGKWQNKQKDQKKFFHHSTDSGEKTDNSAKAGSSKMNFGRKYCWYHGNKGHGSFYCYNLLAMSGKEAADLAKTKGVCTMCGQEKHDPCPNKGSLSKCLMPDCNMKHVAIFCYRRKANERPPKSFKQKESENDKSSSVQTQKEAPDDERLDSAAGGHVNACHGQSSLYNAPWTLREIHTTTQLAVNSNVQKKAEEINSSNMYTDCALIPIVVIDLMHQEKKMRCAIMLDLGSEVSLIDEEYANYLTPNGVERSLSLQWSGGKSRTDTNSRIIKAKAKGIHKNAKTYNIYFRTIRDLKIPDQHFNAEEMRRKFSHLQKLPLESYSKIIGLIGIDQDHFFKQLQWIEGKEKGRKTPTVIMTELGWSVMGHSLPLEQLYEHLASINPPASKSLSHKLKRVIMPEGDEEELMKMQESAMGLEFMLAQENDRKSADDEQALRILEQKVRKLPGENRYEAPLLWRDDHPKLPTEESLSIALRRLRILICHATRIGKLEEIRGQIKNLVAKNYARELTISESKKFTNKTLYNPIFITDPAAKRIRLIWDAAAKIRGKSLNDYLLCGPNLYADLVTILMKMRQGRYMVKGDISEMFHQIQVVKEDQEALRFLFVDNEEKRIIHYQMNALIFGAVCAPTISQYVKNAIANEHREINEKAAESLINDPYVDDYVLSFNDMMEGQRMIKGVRDILKRGGMSLVKLKGNHPEILSLIKSSLSQSEREEEKMFSKEEVEKILGYNVNFSNDTIALHFSFSKFKIELIHGTKSPTKKEVLQILMSIYDPLGLFTFLTAKFKLIYRWTCLDKIDWRQVIRNDLIKYWEQCLKWLQAAMSIEIPRCYSTSITQARRKQLVIFGDAGKEMLCAVAYIRLVDKNDKQIDVSLVAAKSYAVPIKQKRTIPELELDVAWKAVQLRNAVVKNHTIAFDENIFATDNACVYHWVTNGPQKPTQYVKNRYSKIAAETQKSQWIWVPTEWQPADYGTKFESMPMMSAQNKWFSPPIFSLPEENWHNLKPPSEMLKTSLVMNIVEQPMEEPNDYQAAAFDLRRFSSWNKFVRVAQYILRWKYLAVKKVRRLRENTKSAVQHTLRQNLEKELLEHLEKVYQKDFMWREAELLIIRGAQMQKYPTERSILERGGKLPKGNKLLRFCPFVDNDGLMRNKTRLSAKLDYHNDKVNPIVLPKDHQVTKLIIMKYHECNHHVHERTVIVNLMQRFFIPNINWTVKKIIRNNCMHCKRKLAKPDQPQMGDLPSYRLATHLPAFTYVSVDVCGPFEVRRNRGKEKRWLLVVACLTTRAVHIEILYTMSTESCLKALQNTICLRGAPKRIISDRGSNFIGCDNVLKNVQQKWNQELLEKNFIVEPIEWEFNPAKASSMSGSVERIIGLIKQTLKNLHTTLVKKIIFPDDETFRCITCELIGLLNNRPLTMIPLESGDNQFLTPNHFLMLRSNFQSAPSNNKFHSCKLKEWLEVKELVGSLWDHFHKAYVNEIMYKDKWLNFSKPLKEGDLVVVADPTVYNLWRMATVVKAEIGSNGQVRKLTLRLGKNGAIDGKQDIKRAYAKEKYVEITRPASEVAPLNLFSSTMAKAKDN